MQQHDPAPTAPETRSSVPWRAVIVFVVVAFAAAWAAALPMWLHPGTSTMPLMMQAPAVATLVAVFAVGFPKRSRMRLLGVWPLRPAGRVVGMMAVGLFAPIVLVIGTIAVSAAFGWVTLDLEHFSGAAEDSAALATEGMEPASPTLASVLSLIAIMPILAIVPNAFIAFGEEIGWRGWLLPALRPLGTWPALLLTGVIWGLWHMPVILLGVNFYLPDLRGVALMTIGCMAWGVPLGWLRLRSASLWPAVLAHGMLNASASLVFVLHAAGADLPMPLVNPLGVSGWIVVGAVVAVLALAGQFSRQPDLAPRREKGARKRAQQDPAR